MSLTTHKEKIVGGAHNHVIEVLQGWGYIPDVYPTDCYSVMSGEWHVITQYQGVVTTIDSIEAAATGVTMRSQGHGGFSKAVTRLRRFFEAVTRKGNHCDIVLRMRKLFSRILACIIVTSCQATRHGRAFPNLHILATPLTAAIWEVWLL